MAETNHSTPDSRDEQSSSCFPPGDPFGCAYREFHQARSNYVDAKAKLEGAQLKQAEMINALSDADRADMALLEAIDDELQVTPLGDALFARLTLGDQALDAMMRIEAPTSLALALKLQALAECPWEYGQYIDRLTADACTLSLQFAEVWLERWKRLGGTVTTDGADPAKVWIGHPSYHLSPVAEEDAERARAGGLSDGHSAEQRQWHGAFYDGKTRELSDFLDAMPGGLAAVKAIVIANPARGLRSTSEAQEA